MRALVFIHGIVGARMELDGKDIWPPTPLEYAGRYSKIEQLLTPTAVATGIIDRFRVIGDFLYKDIYKPILDDLTDIAKQTDGFTHFVHYDWRLDNWEIGTEVLANAMRQVDARASSITLICHSMGGLIGRLLLETEKYKNEKWMKKIDKALFVCTPHLGAVRPLALALGITPKYFGIYPEDLVRLLGSKHYPAGYQCMPGLGQDVLYDATNPKLPVPQDIYRTEVDKKYNLTRKNVASLKKLRTLLKYEKRPPHVPYFLVAGTGHDTDSAIFYKEPIKAKIRLEDGDGTVTSSSAMPQGIGLVRNSMPGEHLDIFKTDDFKNYLYGLLGGHRPPRIMVDGRPGVVVSLQRDSVRPGEEISVLIIPDGSTTVITGSLRLSKAIVGPTASLAFYRTEVELLYNGTPTNHIASRLTAPNEPGVYRVEFEGSHRSGEAGSAILVVE